MKLNGMAGAFNQRLKLPLPLKLRTGFGSVVSLRALAEFPAAPDATAGDTGDHEVGELP